MKSPEEILKKYWGYDAFRPLQKEIIESVLNGYDTLALMPTGGGKSITYQVSALSKEGICIVITPLISLMKDQVDALRRRKIIAQAIHAGLTAREIDNILDNCVYGDYKFLYVSPERLSTPIFKHRFAKMNVSLIAVDEAHCISQWGYDFRPAYMSIAKIREIHPEVPVLAVTATATKDVATDIMSALKFKTKCLYSMSFARDNLSYLVRYVENKYDHLLRILSSVGGSSIVYCRRRERCEEIAKRLNDSGVTADFYHAGLSAKMRDLKQDSWLKGTTRVIVATNAFGMGIDKQDVRTVIHYEMPSTIESYYQEAGRAGRDLKESFAVLLSDKNDLESSSKRIENEFPPLEKIRECYHSLFNYLAIPIGEGRDTVYDFNVYDFSGKFKIFSTTAISCIKILQLNGYMTLTDPLDNPTRVGFKVSREELYRIELQQPSLESFIKIILRVYTGIFSGIVPIDEEYLAKVSGYTTQHINGLLINLSRLRVITYIPRKQTPLLILNEERLPTDNLYISVESYALRKRLFTERINSMVKYVSDTETCRSAILRRYFGETEVEECGKCDVCRKHKSQSKTKAPESLTQKIFSLITRGVNETHEIPRHIAGEKAIIETHIRNLISDGTLIQNTNGELDINNDKID